MEKKRRNKNREKEEEENGTSPQDKEPLARRWPVVTVPSMHGPPYTQNVELAMSYIHMNTVVKAKLACEYVYLRIFPTLAPLGAEAK